MCFYIQFIHSSIQYTENFIYRYIYRISYINVSPFYSNISVDLSYIKYKKVTGEWHTECRGFVRACLLATICICKSPRSLGGQASARLGELVLWVWGQCGGQSELGMKGVAQTPPDVAWSDRNVQHAYPSGVRQGEDREGVGWPWVSRAESKPAPAPSL